MSAKRPKPKEVFISHASADRLHADRLVRELRAAGVKCWYSRHQLHAAVQWHAAIGRALERCDWMVVLLSPASVRSTWVQRELVYALNHSRYQDRIAPVMIAPCNPERLSWTLTSFQTIRAFPSWEAGLSLLLRGWGIHRVPTPRKVLPARKETT